ncbi:MAG: class I SAM-dependent methyltransferase [Erysipelotrichaceae bacterium]|nr:class I SAM-dependent methyltransferase [Erysipelotrichaceae bacterium]
MNNEILTAINNDKALKSLFSPYQAVFSRAKHAKIFDYGCGYGWGSAYLAGVSDLVVGYDVDCGRIAYAASKYEDISNLRFISQLDLAQDDAFDIVIVSHVLDNGSDEKKMAEEILSKIKDGGSIIICAKAIYLQQLNALIDRIRQMSDVTEETQTDKSAERFGKILTSEMKVRKNKHV